jgi:hypothetical protein
VRRLLSITEAPPRLPPAEAILAGRRRLHGAGVIGTARTSSLYLFRERPAKLWWCMERQVSEPPVVRCPGCNQPMEPKEHVFIRGRLVDIRYVCAVCGMERRKTNRKLQGLGT